MSRYSQTSSLRLDEERSPTARYNMPGSGRREDHETTGIEVDKKEEEHEVDDLRDRMKSSRGSRLNLINRELGFEPEQARRISGSESFINGTRVLSKCTVIHPDNRWYRAWTKIILGWAIYSSFFTPFEFAFFRGLPRKFFLLDIVSQAAFLVDIVLRFFVAYRDSQTHKMVYNHTPIALRYLKSSFVTDLLACMPWDSIYRASGDKEEVRYLLWIRLSRVLKVSDYFYKMERDIRINYMFTRIIKLIAVELYCTHTAACIFYYLATTLPVEQEGYTWIGSLKMGDYSFSSFREIDLWTRYTLSLYFSIVTMTTVGYGDIHAVNLREMIFVMIYISFDMIIGAYLIGNMTALIVKGSKTERFRDKTKDLMKYVNRNKLGRDIRDQIKGHLRLQYESSYTEASVLQDIPISIRAKISQTLYKSYIEDVPLFKGCSLDFINQIVIRVHEEFFLPGEVIMEQGNVVDQLYFVCHGMLEEVAIGAAGLEETVSELEPNSSFGEISILCNIPQPYTVRVCKLSRLLRVDKQSFSSILDIYFHDGRRILNNLLEGKDANVGVKQSESDITFHIGKQEAELALKVNSAAYHRDLHQLKDLIRAGSDPNKTDYDGRSPLHLAASQGYEDITLFLIQEGVDINITDKFGNTPILEALKNGHDRVASQLVKHGAALNIDNVGCFLCTMVARGDSDFLKRLLANGIDPNSKDYDHRTPLHAAISGGFYLMAKMLLGAGASVFSEDRWGNTPLSEARMSGNNKLIKLLEEAKSNQVSEFPNSSQETIDKVRWRKCTVFQSHPWDPKDRTKHGIVLWVPETIEELIKTAAQQLEFPSGSCILSEDAGKILDVDLISDGQKLYLISQTHQT
ncbi:potassium channel SKOR-like [Rhododendron vialii]|uniref:potassium channel SKOR-like n=1 Tax=Rhododendron vialii TaxID=182163 RepID=UPI00265EADA5|nr:potassium channel SKOR-like [Rhododendron vialii]